MPDNETPEEYWQKLDARVKTAKLAVSAQNTFGMHLLRELVAAKPRENTFISPISVFLALSMTEAGSAGSTRTAMRKVLGLPDKDPALLHESMAALQRALKPPSGAHLRIANALWTSEHVPLAPAFVRQCEAVFDAHAGSLSFDKPAAAQIINDWVKANTDGKIPQIVTPDV
ncbi:MAG: serpin family protein, partial [Bryobacteraceae bacterium]